MTGPVDPYAATDVPVTHTYQIAPPPADAAHHRAPKSNAARVAVPPLYAAPSYEPPAPHSAGSVALGGLVVAVALSVAWRGAGRVLRGLRGGARRAPVGRAWALATPTSPVTVAAPAPPPADAAPAENESGTMDDLRALASRIASESAARAPASVPRVNPRRLHTPRVRLLD